MTVADADRCEMPVGFTEKPIAHFPRTCKRRATCVRRNPAGKEFRLCLQHARIEDAHTREQVRS